MMKTLPRRGIRPVQAESQFNRDDTGQARMPPEKFRLRCVTHKNPSTDASSCSRAERVAVGCMPVLGR